MNVTRIFDVLARYRENFPKDDALCFKQNWQWIKYSSHEYIEFAHNFCYGHELLSADKIVSNLIRPEPIS
jgi:hypothetical protein